MMLEIPYDLLVNECYLASAMGMEAMQTLTLSATCEDGEIIVTVCGEMDFSTASALADTLEKCARDATTAVALDLRQVTFIDSEAIKTLLRLKRSFSTEYGIPLYICYCSRQVARTLEMLAIEITLCYAPVSE